MSNPLRPGDAHASCDPGSFAWQEVTCDRCSRTYQCTPHDDHYCAPDGDHCCEKCLLAGLKMYTVGTPLPRRMPRDPSMN